MKNHLLFLCALLFLTACSSDNYNGETPYLPNNPVQITLNLDLPMYAGLRIPGNAAFVDDGISGVLGIIVFNSGSGFRAYDVACPNHPVRDCSALEFDSIGSPVVFCPCEDIDFSLYSGTSLDSPYRLKEYRVTTYRNTLEIYN